MGPEPSQAPAAGRMRHALTRPLLAFLLLNLLLFAGFRVAFLLRYAAAVHGSGQVGVLLYGARLDLVPLGFELAVLGVLALAGRRVRLRVAAALLLAFTLINALYATADFLFYRERNQHLGGLLVDNARHPRVILGEITGYLARQPALTLLGVLGAVALVALLRRLVRRLPDPAFDVGRPPARGWRVAFATLACFLPFLEPVRVNPAYALVGPYTLDVAAARHYTRLDDFLLHEALPNALGELLVTHLPQARQPAPAPRLAEDEALATALALAGRRAADPAWPLETWIEAPAVLGADSVLIVQVESLSASLIEPPDGAKPVMPFLRSLAERSLWFADAWQSFGTTAGGVFSTVSGLPRTVLGEPRGTFTSFELDGVVDSLPRALGPGTHPLFAIAFHQSEEDYRSFASAQGFEFLGPDELLADVQAEQPGANVWGGVGLFDRPFLSALVRRLGALGKPFVAHVITATSHAPWEVPPGFEGPFKDRRFNAFAYTDAALQAAFEALARDPALAARTLVVVLGDHTNLTFGNSEVERWRVPLIFHHPRLAEAGLVGRRLDRASQMDVSATVLALLGGRHRYAGLGRNLLVPDPEGRVLCTGLDEALYASGPWLLRWRPFPPEVRLLDLAFDSLGSVDRSGEQPEVRARLERECFALYETSSRLLRHRRVVGPGR